MTKRLCFRRTDNGPLVITFHSAKLDTAYAENRMVRPDYTLKKHHVGRHITVEIQEELNAASPT